MCVYPVKMLCPGNREVWFAKLVWHEVSRKPSTCCTDESNCLTLHINCLLQLLLTGREKDTHMVFLAHGGADIWNMHRFETHFIACWGMFWYNFKKILLNMCVHVHFIFSYSVSVNVHIWHILRAHCPCLCAMYHQQARTDLHYLDVFEQIRPAHNLVDMVLINYCP